MRLSHVMDLIEALEATAPVDEWSVDGLHLWPLARAQLVTSLEDVAVAISAGPGVGAAAVTYRVRSVARSVSGRAMLAIRDRAHAASRHAAADIVVLSDNVVRQWHAGGWYDDVAEPLMECAEVCGFTTLLAETANKYRAPRTRATRPVQLQLDVIKARSIVSSRLARSSRIALPGHDAASRLLLSRSVDPTVLAPHVLVARARHVILARAFFERLLRRAGARLGVTTSNGVIPMAFHAACAHQGIPSVDVQHGVQGEQHWAYARWTRVPAAGYELLPSVYWVWRPVEAQAIERWIGATQSNHRVVVGGNLWLERWRTGTAPEVVEWDARMRALTDAHPASRNVLVTLQTGLATDGMLTLVRTLADRAPHWRFWVRTRATMSATELRRTEQTLAACDNVELASSSTFPLYVLLRHMDAHLTATSTTVIEAEAFGVPSVTVGDEAPALYPELVSTGWVVAAAGAAGVLDALTTHMQEGRRRSRVWMPPAPSGCTLFQELLSR